MNIAIKLFIIGLPILFFLDIIWLGFVAKNFYRSRIGFLMKDRTNWGAAILFYCIFIIGLVVFVLLPAVEKSSWVHALLFGGLFGVICYATYDLTNLAVAKDWPLSVTIVDMLWGGVIAGVVSYATYMTFLIV